MKKSGIYGVLLVAGLLLVGGIGGAIETNYSRDAVVTEVNGEEIMVVDKTNNEWVFTGEGYEVGDEVTLKMFNGYTDNTLKDDEIRRVVKHRK